MSTRERHGLWLPLELVDLPTLSIGLRECPAGGLPESLIIRAAGEPSELRICGETSGFELQAAEGESKIPRFSMTAYTGGAMNVGFGWPVVVDLEGMQVPSQARPILYGHDASQIVGHTSSIEVSQQRIKVAGLISGKGGEAADQVIRLAGNGFPWQASIGASIQKLEFVDRGETVKVNGRSFTGPVYVARATILGEVSFVPIGADSNTSANVAARKGNTMPPFEQWLKAKGFDIATLTAEGRAALQAQYDAEHRPNPAPTPTPPPIAPPVRTREQIEAEQRADEERRIQARRQADAAEDERQAGIRRVVAQRGVTQIEIEANGQRSQVDLQAHAIRSGWTVDQTELAAVRAARVDVPAGHIRSHDRDCTLQALQGAMMLRAGARLDHPCYQTPQAVALGLSPWLRAGLNNDVRARAMEWAHRFSHMSAIDLCREACRLDGREPPLERDRLIQAAFSGSSLTQIFTDSVNARLLSTYMEAGDTTQAWTQETEVADFKTNTDIQLTKGGPLAKLPRGAEADHTTRSDEAETYNIARYARQFVVDEQDIIDDALNALSDIPVEMGNAAARLRPDLVYAIILANPTLAATARAMFNSTDDNVDTSSALASATLKTGIANMNLKQMQGVNLNLQPTHLIVPSTLRFTGRELIASSTIVLAGTAGSVTERGSQNVLQNEGLQLVSDARLENGVTDPSSGTAYSGSSSTWYLACAIAKTILVAYLRGTGRAPQSRSFVLTQGKWGIGWDIKMDIGAKARDYRGLYRATA